MGARISGRFVESDSANCSSDVGAELYAELDGAVRTAVDNRRHGAA